jgi:hypothetical protein
MSTEIRGVGGILTGDLANPRASGTAIGIDDGRISWIGDSRGNAETVVDARGAIAMPGLWDGSAALYFGDHEPQFSGRGANAAAVEYGTTSLVVGGRVDIPGWVGDPRSRRELAVLMAKSWRYDRPRGIKVHPGIVEGDPDWTADDLADLAANGASTLIVPTDSSGDAAGRLAARARTSGLRIGGRAGAGTDVPELAALQPDVVYLHGADRTVARNVLEQTTAAVGVLFSDGIATATDVVCAAADRSELGRVFVGSGLPGRAGVLPGAMALFLETLGATTGLAREQLVALATANVARAFGLPGGMLGVGQPADVVLIDGEPGTASGWARSVRASYIDGQSAWSREANG